MLKRISLHFRDPKVLSNISDDQIRRARTVTGYVKVLGDQQLITGLAIVIAALALRHEITLYEFRIVTSLAYFAAFTHLCSLYILREYMYHHKTARAWHMAFTVGFLGLLCLAFVVDSMIDDFDAIGETSLNPGNTLQCFFERTQRNKEVIVGFPNYFVIIGGLVAHMRVLSDLFVLPSSSFTSNFLYRLMIPRLRKSHFSPQDREAILQNAGKKYWAWLRPSGIGESSQAISFWYMIETYHDSELSFIPTMLAFFAYGTSRIFLTMMPQGLQLSGNIFTLGFGQVVTVGLLALTLLTMTEIHNGQLDTPQNYFLSLH
jgi:hypothetical protein